MLTGTEPSKWLVGRPVYDSSIDEEGVETLQVELDHDLLLSLLTQSTIPAMGKLDRCSRIETLLSSLSWGRRSPRKAVGLAVFTVGGAATEKLTGDGSLSAPRAFPA